MEKAVGNLEVLKHIEVPWLEYLLCSTTSRYRQRQQRQQRQPHRARASLPAAVRSFFNSRTTFFVVFLVVVHISNPPFETNSTSVLGTSQVTSQNKLRNGSNEYENRPTSCRHGKATKGRRLRKRVPLRVPVATARKVPEVSTACTNSYRLSVYDFCEMLNTPARDLRICRQLCVA